MAIVTDPDTLSRYDVIFGTADQKVSMYPIGDTQRGSTVTDAYVTGTGTIDRASGSWTTDGAVAGDVVAILDSQDAGHYFLNTSGATQLTLTDIDDGTAGAATTGLVVSDSGTFQSANINFTTDVITLAAHGYTTGHALVYDDGGGTAPTGLTDGDVVYVIWTSASEFQIATSYANALAGTEINMSVGSMAGTSHIFHDRILVGTFNNGANSSPGESINGNDTTGDGDGDIVDGVTLQTIYSFGKEEWRTDSLITDLSGSWNDDLIRHQYPYESITAEQFEIGGGSSHDDWQWFNEYTRKKVRTAGWAAKTLFSTTNDLDRYTGVITLGSLDTDAQVYYQQTSATTTPADFTFPGAVNEALEIYRDDNQDGTPDETYLTYLKLFVRKKARSYAQSEIADIGVSSIQTIVNRFPLAHVVDPAITNTDGEILGGNTFFRGTEQLTLAGDEIDGSKTAGQLTFTDSDATLQTDGVVAGDTLRITSGTETGYYTISTVDSETQVTIVGDFEKSGGWDSTESSLTYEIYTPVINGVTKATGTITDLTDGVVANVDGDTGTLTSASADFTTPTDPLFAVAAGDILWIKETSSEFYGIYEVNSATATVLTVKTPDTQFDGSTGIDYRVFKAGMYLEYKKETTQEPVASVTNVAFDNSAKTIIITGGTFDASIAAGTIIEITGSENGGENDGSFTVLSRDSGTQVTLISTDTLVTNATDTTAAVNVYEGFKRSIGGTTYAFNWKVSGNGQGLGSVFQFIQHQLRQTGSIDFGEGLDTGAVSRGDITDLLMSFSTPTGTGLNLYIDDLDANDINNATFQDHSGTARNFPFTAAGNLTFNSNLVDDTNAKYWLFFTNDDAGDNIGRDYGTEYAIIVDDDTNTDIAGDVTAATIAFTYAYDTNTQRGSASAATDAPVTLVAIGLDTAQFVVSTGTITRATGLTISATAALERNYSNPA